MVMQTLWKCKKERKEVDPQLMWVQMKVDYEKWVIITTYAPGHEKTDEEL